jgi:hypothetical protein
MYVNANGQIKSSMESQGKITTSISYKSQIIV